MSRTFLITGASKGIGSALAHRLTRGGHQVVGLARNAGSNFPGVLVPVDLVDTRATDDASKDLTARFRFDGVINNVGLVRPQRLDAVESTVSDEVSRANSHPALQMRTAYAAAKAALVSFSRSWASESATTGITVNAVSPGPTETESFRANNPPGSDGERRYSFSVPMTRFGQPDEIAAAIAF
ncbi:hypothetical protein OY671_007656, partial [Metschnikowia pulcherrima]